jgi:hypothetical protein
MIPDEIRNLPDNPEWESELTNEEIEEMEISEWENKYQSDKEEIANERN